MRFSRPRFFYRLVRLARSLAPIATMVPVAALALGCVSQRGFTPVGAGQVTSSGHAAVGAPGTGTVALAPAVTVPADLPDADLRIDYQIWLPRAMEVRWQVTCGGRTVDGQAGETFEAYQARRLAELRAERERAQRAAAQVGSVVGGALLGQQAVTASAGGPGASAQAGVAVDGRAAGAAAGAATVSTDVALAPDDVGQGYRRGHVELLSAPPGACTMDVTPLVRAPEAAVDGASAGDGAAIAAAPAPMIDPMIDPALITGTFSVARRDDPARRRAIVARQGALELRGSLRASLVAAGADADLEAARARNRARAETALAAQTAATAEARAAEDARRAREEAAFEARRARVQARVALRLEAEARARARAEARLEAARSTRLELVAYLERCGGDPHRRARLEAEARARAELALELSARRRSLAFELRGRLHASLVAAGADPELRDRLFAESVREANARAAARDRAEALAAAEARARAVARAEADRAARAEADRRLAIALELRGRISAGLVASGARLRPPMPPQIDENPGPPPVADATWIGGGWVWSGARDTGGRGAIRRAIRYGR